MNKDGTPAASITRRALFDRIWSKPMTTNAAELGTTTSALSSLAQRVGLPLPRAGHWMKKEVGKEPPIPDFPANSGLDEKTYSLPASGVRAMLRLVPAKV